MWTQQSQGKGLVALRHVGSEFLDQGLNLHPLPCKADSEPLDLQRSLKLSFNVGKELIKWRRE